MARARKYPAIQILRFVAASFVVIDHAIANVVGHWSNAAVLGPTAWAFGELGVIVFFGISGFIMANTQYESFGSVPRALDFSIRRIIRIVPIYTIATTLEYLHRMRQGDGYNFVNYLKSIFFIPYLIPSVDYEGAWQPVLGQGWTLNYEMFFYLVFALSLCLNRPLGLLLSTGGFAVLASLQGAVTVNGPFAFYLNHILLYFICGMLVAVALKHLNFRVMRLSASMLGVLSVMLLAVVLRVSISESRFLVLGLILVVASVLICASYTSDVTSRFQLLLERLGDASYSTYLFHGFLMGALKYVSNRIGDRQYLIAVVFVLFSVAAANFVGWVAFTYLELPTAKVLNRRRRRTLLDASAPS